MNIMPIETGMKYNGKIPEAVPGAIGKLMQQMVIFIRFQGRLLEM